MHTFMHEQSVRLLCNKRRHTVVRKCVMASQPHTSAVAIASSNVGKPTTLAVSKIPLPSYVPQQLCYITTALHSARIADSQSHGWNFDRWGLQWRFVPTAIIELAKSSRHQRWESVMLL